MIKLKPCPFCGGEAEFERVGTARMSTIVSCTECGATLESGEAGEIAGTSWNSREADEQLAKANERAKELEKQKIKWDRLPEGTQELRVEFDGDICDIGCFDGAGNMYSHGEWDLPFAVERWLLIAKQLRKEHKK